MRMITIVTVLLLLAGGAFAEKYAELKCDADSYTSMTNPNTNYGTATELSSLMQYSYLGNTFSNINFNYAYFHFQLPQNLIGKVNLLEAGGNFYVNSYKAKSPYTSGEAVYGVGLFPVQAPWDELTITYTNAPTQVGPAFFSGDSSSHGWTPKKGWNKFIIVKYGCAMLQKLLDTGINNHGLALTVTISGPTGQPLAQGDYITQLNVASRETVRNAAYIIIGYEAKPGVITDNTLVNPASLGEVKAQYH